MGSVLRNSLLAALWCSLPVMAAGPRIGGCPVFPEDNIWNTVVSDLPVAARSDDYVRSIGADLRLHPDFGSGRWGGSNTGIPYTVARAGERLTQVQLDVPSESDPGPFPIPARAPIEGDPRPSARSDRHVLVLDEARCRLIELVGAHRFAEGGWRAGAAAVFDLRSHRLRPAGWTSADAAGLPILPGLVRYEEAATGEIRHALRFTAPKTQRAYVWPARHQASPLNDPRLPPMGQRFRLKATVRVTGFSLEARAILVALQRYGMILADNGGPWFVSGVPDERWNNLVLLELKRLRGTDFEAVDVSGLMVSPDSGRAVRR